MENSFYQQFKHNLITKYISAKTGDKFIGHLICKPKLIKIMSRCIFSLGFYFWINLIMICYYEHMWLVVWTLTRYLSTFRDLYTIANMVTESDKGKFECHKKIIFQYWNCTSCDEKLFNRPYDTQLHRVYGLGYTHCQYK